MKPPEWLGKYPVLPIINRAKPDEALLIAEALIKGGLEIMEITLRTEEAMGSLCAVRKEFPKLILGAGSVITPYQLDWIKGEGLDFAVSPGWSDLCWKKASSFNLPFFPGVLTPTELMHAINEGCLHPKVFPIGPMGGIDYFRALLAPFREQKIQCVPTGGIKQHQVFDYVRNPHVSMVGGSWITPKEMVNQKDFEGITELAKSSLLLANINQ